MTVAEMDRFRFALQVIAAGETTDPAQMAREALAGTNDMDCHAQGMGHMFRGSDVCEFCGALKQTTPVWDEAAIRIWCEGITKQTFAQKIEPQGKPYLLRYFIIGWNPLTKQPKSTMYLHHFLASDPAEEVHSHPWAWGISLILTGGYREYRCADDDVSSVSLYEPGDVNVFTAADRHRIELLDKDCWTLLLVGPYQQPWGFTPACD